MPDWSLLVLLLSVLLLTAAALDTEEKQKESYGSSNVSASKGPPLNVVTMPVGANTLSVSWDPPEEPPGHYKIDYLTENTIISNTTYDITELKSCETYAITVTSMYDDGPEYPAITLGRTNAPVPPPPQYCSFTAVTSSNVTVVWPDPELVCGTFNHSISWSWDVLWSDEEGSGEVFSDVTSAIIDNLSPYTNVTVDISVISTGGAGLPTTCWTVTSEATPGPPSNMVLQLNLTSVTVTWDPPEEENGKIIGYKVTWDGGNGDSGEDTVDYSVLSYTIQNLILCLEYNISVSASTSMGWGTKEEKAVIPNYLPVDALECNGNESREVKLAWSLASPECPVSEYSLAWNTSVVWSNQQAGNTTTLPGTSTSFLIDNLQPYSEIYACLIVEPVEGGASCCTTTTQEEEPGPPVNLRVTSYNGSATVSWTPPDKANGVISIYEVNCESGSHSKSTNVTGEDTEAVVDDLQVCENYSVTVRALTEAGGWGPESQPAIVTIDGALVPSSVECSPDEDVNVRVCWTPSPGYCPMSSYNITWDGTKLWGPNTDHLDGSGSKPWDDESHLCYSLDTSVPYATYNVCVTSVAEHNTARACCSMTTPEAAASEPVSFTVVNKTTSEAAFTWSPPQHLNGKLESWILVWTQDNGKTDITIINSKVYKYVLKDLQSSTKYNVSLMAYNGAGLGNPATVEVTTDPDSVASNVGVIVGVTVGALVVIVIVGVGVFIYYRKKTLSNTPSDDRSNRGKRIWSGAAGNRSDSNSTISNNMVNDNSSSRYNDMTRGSAPGSEDYLTKAIEISKLNAIKQGSALPRHNGITNGYASSSEDESINGSIYSVPIYEKPIYMQVVREGRSRKAPQPPRPLELSTLSDDNTNDDTYPKGRRDQRLQRQNNIGMNGDSGLNRPREPYSRTSSRANNYPPGY